MTDNSGARAIPGHPAFGALAPWLDHGLAALTLDRLNALARASDPQAATDASAAVKFVAAAGRLSAIDYESRILTSGEVATRSDNAHDVFNALCWIAFPAAKRACNALHAAHRRAGAGRGAVRDAATLFDESGVIALCADRALGELLQRRQWKKLFCDRRSEAVGALRFFVFGHALYEKLLAPYRAITGRVLIVDVDATTFECAGPALRTIADAEAASRLRALDAAPDIPPLPLAGIPGWDPENSDPAFYDDRIVFRVS
jgi:hypothetical protein